MKWEQLRQILNSIAEGESKDVLDEPVRRVGEDYWALELVVSALSGRLTFIDVLESEDGQ
jgi:hypothetical protein